MILLLDKTMTKIFLQLLYNLPHIHINSILNLFLFAIIDTLDSHQEIIFSNLLLSIGYCLASIPDYA